MKINQVEELVGITKKNIRFYEEQELLKPGRNPENGYREYSLEDVARLEKIKLLRKLAMPIEEIRLLLEEKISLRECMEKHALFLDHEKQNLELIRELCGRMMNEVDEVTGMNAGKYLEEMEHLEKEGTRFMDIEKRDITKKKIGPVLAALIVVAFLLGTISFIVWACLQEPAPIGVMIVPAIIIGVVMVGVIVALIQRLKEIDGGEEDEASKY